MQFHRIITSSLRKQIVKLDYVRDVPLSSDDFFHGEKLCITNVKGYNFLVRYNSNDKRVINESFISKTYGDVPKGSVVLDIGANIGDYTVFASQTASKVYAFEPFPDNFELLKKNIIINGIDNVFISDEAVSSEDHIMKLHVSDISHGSHSPLYAVGNKEIDVSSISVPLIFKRYGIEHVDILKMDIEGGEYDVLMNLEKPFFEKIGRFELEYHDYFKNKYSHENLVEKLEDNGFKVKLDGYNPVLRKVLKQGLIHAWK
jgi:FkbM family methyltransferase